MAKNKVTTSFPDDDLPKREQAQGEPMFVTWTNDAERVRAISDLAMFHIQEDSGRNREKARANRMVNYKDVDTGVNVRPTFTRDSYDYFRPEEATPKKRKEILNHCSVAYSKIGLIKNVIDLMGDFACQGIKIVHKDEKAQKVCEKWAEKVNLAERSERFLNMLYRLGTVPIITNFATLNNIDVKNIQQFMDPDNITIDDSRPVSDIPWGYTFLHPNTIDVIGGDISLFGSSKIQYGLSIPDGLKKVIISPTTAEQKEAVAGLPVEVRNAAKNNKPYPLGDNFHISFYKKDDWDQFPKPMIYAILDDVMMLEKLKLTDLSACDTVISSVRLWRLGDLENKIMPTPAAIAKLSNVISNNQGGGSYDLIWDATLDFKETSSDAYKFLGEEKYKPTLNRIYAGLGIPPTLTGSATASGFTNNYISLKTLTERLEYGRKVLVAFWNSQMKIIQKALGLKEPPRVVFDRMTLSDEAAEKNLLLGLVDRQIISEETIRDRFGEISDIEAARIKREEIKRKAEEIPPKAGPYHNAQTKEELTKMFVQHGSVAPSQVGLKMGEKKEGEKTPMDIKGANDAKKAKAKGTPGGRPIGKKDTKKRKTKVVKPRSKAEFINTQLWAKETQDKITGFVLPKMLQVYGKANARSLSDIQLSAIEQIKFNILAKLEPFSNINDEALSAAAVAEGVNHMDAVYNHLITSFINRHQKQPTIDDTREIRAYAYSLYHEELNNAEDDD